MKTRIKVIEKRNGTKKYIPQVYSTEMAIWAVVSVPLRIIAIPLCLVFQAEDPWIKNKIWKNIITSEYSSKIWAPRGMYYAKRKRYIHSSDEKKIFNTLEEAQDAIRKYLMWIEAKRRYWNIVDCRTNGDKLKQITYVKYP